MVQVLNEETADVSQGMIKMSRVRVREGFQDQMFPKYGHGDMADVDLH